MFAVIIFDSILEEGMEMTLKFSPFDDLEE